MKEILKIRCQINILMKKRIILRNASGNEDFRSAFLQPFQFESEQKKTCGNKSHNKETKHSHASAADSLHIRMSIYYILEFQPRLVRMRKWQKQSDRNRLTLLQRGECNAYCYG